MSEDEGGLDGPLPEDFLAEYEEHQAGIERALLELERAGAIGEADVAVLLRRLHTLKGLSGMVGLGEAAALAHAMESALRGLRHGGRAPAKGVLDALIEAGRALALALSDRRHGAAPRDFSALIRLLSADGETAAREVPDAPLPSTAEGSIALTAAQRREIKKSARAGMDVLRATFGPSVALSARGVTVSSVRARLEARGKILSAAPVVEPGGSVRFEFVVVCPRGAVVPGDWAPDGVRVETYDVTLPEAGSDGEPLLSPSNTIRVGMDKLDDLMGIVGELVVKRARLSELTGGLSRWVPRHELRALDEASLQLERQVHMLREAVTHVRLVPIGGAFARMPFATRAVAREEGKSIRVELSGQETELDKFVVDRMTEPLLHLVRNAAAHGIERPEGRRAAGKPAEGRISLRAAAQADRVVVEVEDDGAGIDAEAVRRRGAALGLLPPGHEGPLDEDRLLEILCAPGLSTRAGADLGSGRGVGMTAVRDAVRDLGGRLSLRTTPGAGSVFTIEIPVTMLIIQALLVQDAGRTYAVPSTSVEEVMEASVAGAATIGGSPVLAYRGGTLAVASLGQTLGAARTRGRHVLVARGGGLGFAVERVLGQKEIVVSPLTDPWVRSPGVSGATRLPDGTILLILDLKTLARTNA